MGVFERIKSAVAGAIPVEDDLDMGNSQRMKNLPSSADPSDAVSETEAQGKVDTHEGEANPHSGSFAASNYTPEADTHAQNHDNTDHTTSYLPSVNYDPEADTHSRYTDGEAAAAAPVDSVNGQTGAVTVSTGGGWQVDSYSPGSHTWQKPAGCEIVQFVVVGAGGASSEIDGAAGGGALSGTVQADLLPSSVPVAVGAGGTSGTNEDGGESLFWELVAAGVGGANPANANPGEGGGVTAPIFANGASGGDGASYQDASDSFSPAGGGRYNTQGGQSAFFGDGGDGGGGDGGFPGGGGSGEGGGGGDGQVIVSAFVE